MEKVVYDTLAPMVRSFISDWGFALPHKAGKWLDAKIPNKPVRAVIGFVLCFAAVAAIVVITALAGF